MSETPEAAPPSAADRAHALGLKARKALGDPRASVNLRWLRTLSGAPVDRILEVLAELDGLVPVEQEMRRRQVAGGRPGYAQICAPFELYALVRLLKPSHVVETGVSSGVSSAHFLLALDRNHGGVLHSIDLPTHQRGPILQPDESPVSLPPGLASGWAIPFRSPRWDLRVGESQVLLPRLVEELPSIDLFLHDDLHTPEHLAFELETVRPKLAPGAPVLADNTKWTGDAAPRFAAQLGTRTSRRGTGDLVGFRVPTRARRKTTPPDPAPAG
ncbi:MAG TPA: class I SAM-dependent methyltransferase [Thermoplasmata archaeon]|nr:class I SAM-dependent methyltransferase [Thermoplasmata archaeon]